MYYKKSVIIDNGRISKVFVTKCKMAMYGNGKRRAARLQPTSEAVNRHNINKAIEAVYYLLLLNFKPGDLHAVFTYPAGTVQTIAEAKDKFSKFLRKYRDYCKQHGYKADYIYNTEIGKRGAIHHHCVMHNNRDEYELSLMWAQFGGSIQLKSYLWANYDWHGLAEYLVDKTKGGTLPDTHIPGERRYVPSKGLIRPVYKYERVDADRWHKPKAPRGYELEPDSVRSGIHELSGGAYIKYTLRRLM